MAGRVSNLAGAGMTPLGVDYKLSITLSAYSRPWAR